MNNNEYINSEYEKQTNKTEEWEKIIIVPTDGISVWISLVDYREILEHFNLGQSEKHNNVSVETILDSPHVKVSQEFLSYVHTHSKNPKYCPKLILINVYDIDGSYYTRSR